MYLSLLISVISQRKPSRQKSTAASGSSSRATDGNKNSNWGGGTCTHTSEQNTIHNLHNLSHDGSTEYPHIINIGNICSVHVCTDSSIHCTTEVVVQYVLLLGATRLIYTGINIVTSFTRQLLLYLHYMCF